LTPQEFLEYPDGVKTMTPQEATMSYLSSNPTTIAVAAELAARNFSTAGDFEDEAECETCDYAGLMEFYENGVEEAVAECPKCGDRVEKYTGPDA
jgi:hypothetical protein